VQHCIDDPQVDCGNGTKEDHLQIATLSLI
jgi:hypothetical protein